MHLSPLQEGLQFHTCRTSYNLTRTLQASSIGCVAASCARGARGASLGASLLALACTSSMIHAFAETECIGLLPLQGSLSNITGLQPCLLYLLRPTQALHRRACEKTTKHAKLEILAAPSHKTCHETFLLLELANEWKWQLSRKRLAASKVQCWLTGSGAWEAAHWQKPLRQRLMSPHKIQGSQGRLRTAVFVSTTGISSSAAAAASARVGAPHCASAA